jgi:hypothetical protein
MLSPLDGQQAGGSPMSEEKNTRYDTEHLF